jgi:hypothetical protein
MEILPVDHEARIHREASIAVLRGWLKDWPTHRAFAVQIGRSRVYLESLLREDGLRTPGAVTAERIVRTLSLADDQRDDLLEQMHLASERRLRAWRALHMLVAESPPEETLERLRAAHWAATYTTDPAQAQKQYQILRDAATVLLQQDGMRQRPLTVVETCLILHDVESVLDRPGAALSHARFARAIMGRLDPGDYRRRDRFAHFRVNTLYAEVVTLNNLGLASQAEERSAEAEAAMSASGTAAEFWAPHILRGKLAAMSGRARFSLYQVRELADQVRALCDRRGDPLDRQVALHADIALARAYVGYGGRLNLQKADDLLRSDVEHIDRFHDLTLLRRVSLLRTFALICRARGRLDEWEQYVRQALALAEAAGLEHQIHAIRREGGDVIPALTL